MENVIKIIRELELTSSTNAKIKILEREKDNKKFTDVLRYTYSDNLQYGFSEKKLRELLVAKIPLNKNTWSNGFDMLDKLATSNINDALRVNVRTFLLTQSEGVRELYIRILTKDLRCNISSKTIDKAIKGLIPKHEIQQAYPLSKVKLKKGEWIALSLKLNGVRSSFLDGQFKSRQNKIMNGFKHIAKDLETLGIDHLFVDGEMVRKNIDNVPDNENFRLTTSIVNSDDSDKTQIKFVIFDIITKEDFMVGESVLGFKDRLKLLDELKDKIKKLGLKNIDVVDTYYTGTDHSMIDILLEKVDSEGLEGLMLLRDCKYKTKRNNGILKCKVFKTCEIPIVGFEEGTGKLIGTLGSVVAKYKGVNTVAIGSGYTDEQRAFIWSHKDELLGRMIEVKYKEESKDKTTGLPSIQFPTFVCIREEGKLESYN